MTDMEQSAPKHDFTVKIGDLVQISDVHIKLVPSVSFWSTGLYTIFHIDNGIVSKWRPAPYAAQDIAIISSIKEYPKWNVCTLALSSGEVGYLEDGMLMQTSEQPDVLPREVTLLPETLEKWCLR
jgi:hypothetical protein